MEKDNKKPVKATEKQKEFVKNTIELNPKLNEATGKTVVFGWGRMNPITIGHEKLSDKIKDVARKNRATPMMYLTHSQDAKKNPLSYDDKVMLAKKAFGNMIQKSNAKTIIEVMKALDGKFDTAILVAGSDRVSEFTTLLNKYNGKEYTFDTISVVSAGERDPDAEGVEGMSASKMRSLASQGDYETFKKGLPRGLQSYSQEVYDLVRGGMKIAEELELDEAVLNIAQRRKRGLIMRKYKTKIAAARNRAKRKMASTDALTTRARKAAIKAVRTKIAGTKGSNYANLSPSEKMMIDKRVATRQKSIERIARKLMPKVRQAERDRLRSANSTKKEEFEVMSESTNNPATKKFHELFYKDNTVKIDKRFKIYKSKNEDLELINMIESLSDEIYRSIDMAENKIKNALFEKSENSNIPLSEITEAYTSGVDLWNESSSFDTPSQLGFANVSCLIAENKPGLWDNIRKRRNKGLPPKKPGEDGYPKTLDVGEEAMSEVKKPGLWDNINAKQKRIKAGSGEKMRKPGSEGAPTNQDFKDAAEATSPEDRMYAAAVKVLMSVLDRKGKEVPGQKDTRKFTKGPAHSVGYYAAQVARSYPNMDAGRLENMLPENYGEEYGAGEEGTTNLSKKYKKDTPGQSVNEAFETLMESECQLIGMKQIKEFEKVVDNLFKKYDIDFNFTRHFGDRMSDERNTPCITLKELAEFIKKIYAKQGKSLKGVAGAEAVIKDMQTDLNIPVAVTYDSKNDEFDVVMKTIMRKKNFKTPDKIITY